MDIEYLETDAKNLGVEISKLETLLAKIKNEWCGPGSSEYQRQLQLLIADMKSTQNSLNSMAKRLRATLVSEVPSNNVSNTSYLI